MFVFPKRCLSGFIWDIAVIRAGVSVMMSPVSSWRTGTRFFGLMARYFSGNPCLTLIDVMLNSSPASRRRMWVAREHDPGQSQSFNFAIL